MPTLTWLSRGEDMRGAALVPYCALADVPDMGYGDSVAGNLLIHADNLKGLKALCPHYASSVKCVFIDPPYNTRTDFVHYRDNLEHAQWLEMMYPRLTLLYQLLADDGSIWVIIDDDEGHYLKVLMDEIFGRKNFVANVVWQKKYSPHNKTKLLSDNHDHILCYAKNKQQWQAFLLPRTAEMNNRYKNPDNDPRGRWKPADSSGYDSEKDDKKYPIITPSGKSVSPPPGRTWLYSREKFEAERAQDRIWFGKKGDSIPQIKRYLTEVKDGITSSTIWLHTEAGHNQNSRQEANALNAKNPFPTAKPERLIQRVLHLATKPGDLVLDSFLGSGTTAAVAHKMNRRYIGLEMEQTAITHCAPRLRAVIDGEQGGISKDVNWQGGGGFRFLRLGGEVFDEDGAVSAGLAFADLAAHLWFAETHKPFVPQKQSSPFLGVYNNTGYALLYNGILGDKKVDGGNILTGKTLAAIRRDAKGFGGGIVVYAYGNRFGKVRMQNENLDWRQIPYDCKNDV